MLVVGVESDLQKIPKSLWIKALNPIHVMFVNDQKTAVGLNQMNITADFGTSSLMQQYTKTIIHKQN